MSLFDPTPAEQAATEARLWLLRLSAVKGPKMTPMQALDAAIATGDTKAVALKRTILTYRSNMSSVCEKQPCIHRPMTLRAPAVVITQTVVRAPKVTFKQ